VPGLAENLLGGLPLWRQSAGPPSLPDVARRSGGWRHTFPPVLQSSAMVHRAPRDQCCPIRPLPACFERVVILLGGGRRASGASWPRRDESRTADVPEAVLVNSQSQCTCWALVCPRWAAWRHHQGTHWCLVTYRPCSSRAVFLVGYGAARSVACSWVLLLLAGLEWLLA
jgi:hypothetical protein